MASAIEGLSFFEKYEASDVNPTANNTDTIWTDKKDLPVNNEDSNLENKNMRAALSNVATKLGLLSPYAPSPTTYYYGVYIPPEAALPTDEDILHVYTDKAEVMKVVKQFKKARFKQFKTQAEAVSFAVRGAEVPVSSGSCANGGSEKAIPFKGPKTQDMIKFRKAIDCGDLAMVKKLIWENPRYLVSSGDTPSILQEGSRYNALHVAAKAKNVEMCRLVLDTVSSVQFVSRLYDDHDTTSCQVRADMLLDLYLNMPDKGLNETPLHFAAKHGAVEVVRLLVSYPQCQRGALNKYEHSAKDVACTRVVQECAAAKDAILALLDEQFYVPVLRYEDNSLQPRVGEPFSPTLSPVRVPQDPLSPRLEIQAYAGPMNRSDANVLKKMWRTPPTGGSRVKLSDTEKGLESIGRSLAAEMKIPWREYWPFLGTFVDLSTDEGLVLLEEHLKTRFNETFLEVSRNEEQDTTVEELSPLSPISDLCEAFTACTLNDLSMTNTRPLTLHYRTSTPQKVKQVERQTSPQVPPLNPGASPRLYLERSYQVFAKRLSTAAYAVLASCNDVYELATDSLMDALMSEARHLRTLVLSYLHDPRFTDLDVEAIHVQVVQLAAATLNQRMSAEEKELLVNSIAGFNLSDEERSEDDEPNYERGFARKLNDHLELKRHAACLMMLLSHSFSTGSSVVPSCCCVWSSSPNGRSSRKRHYVNDQQSPRKALFPTHEEDHEFHTPPGSPRKEAHQDGSDGEMQDPCDFPDTFIYPGDIPTKTDYSVLDAITPSASKITPTTFPNIYRWRHLVQLALKDKGLSRCPGGRIRRLSISGRSREWSSLNESVELVEASEPWERVTGTLSPMRRSRRSFSELPASPLGR